MAAVQLVAAVGADEQQALVAQAVQQRGEELERGAVGPVQVLDREEHGRVDGQPVQDPPQQREQAGLSERVARGSHVLATPVLRRAGAQLGHEPCQLAVCGSEQVVDG